jgi:hypothetical protein
MICSRGSRILAVKKAGREFEERGVFRILEESAGCRDARVREGSSRDWGRDGESLLDLLQLHFQTSIKLLPLRDYYTTQSHPT